MDALPQWQRDKVYSLATIVPCTRGEALQRLEQTQFDSTAAVESFHNDQINVSSTSNASSRSQHVKERVKQAKTLASSLVTRFKPSNI